MVMLRALAIIALSCLWLVFLGGSIGLADILALAVEAVLKGFAGVFLFSEFAAVVVVLEGADGIAGILFDMGDDSCGNGDAVEMVPASLRLMRLSPMARRGQ